MWSDIDRRIQTPSLGKIGSSLSSYLYILRVADIAGRLRKYSRLLILTTRDLCGIRPALGCSLSPVAQSVLQTTCEFEPGDGAQLFATPWISRHLANKQLRDERQKRARRYDMKCEWIQGKQWWYKRNVMTASVVDVERGRIICTPCFLTPPPGLFLFHLICVPHCPEDISI